MSRRPPRSSAHGTENADVSTVRSRCMVCLYIDLSLWFIELLQVSCAFNWHGVVLPHQFYAKLLEITYITIIFV